MSYEKQKILSYRFNMSMGFLPVIIAILLRGVAAQDVAIYVGTGIGLVGMFLSSRVKGAMMPNFILAISTFMLVLQSIAAAIPGDHVPQGYLPLTLEVSILIPMLILYMHKRRFINHYLRKKTSCEKRLYAQGAEAAVVSARITLLLGVLHFLAITVASIVQSPPLDGASEFVLLRVMPPLVFILAIALNHVAIRSFNRLMSHVEYVPVVNVKGDVIGKVTAMDAINQKNSYINPVLRIAVSNKNMPFLCERSSTAILDSGKIDLPMECYLRYGETLLEGIERLLGATFPLAKDLKPEFTIRYHYENQVTNRLIYLFILDLPDEDMLHSPQLKNGKLWNFKQIEANLGKGFFSHCFEEEYEHLKEIICIKEKYRAS